MSVSSVIPPLPHGYERYLVTFPRDRVDAGLTRLRNLLDIYIVSNTGAQSVTLGTGPTDARGVSFPRLRAAIALVAPEKRSSLLDATGADSLLLTAETIGYGNAEPTEPGTTPAPGGLWAEDDASAWGLKAIRWKGDTGKGVRVAIIDSGLGPCMNIDPARVVAWEPIHPEFPGCATDGNGHGTMCASIACGGVTSTGKRFGIASQADLVICRVVNAAGTCAPEYVLQGLQRALAHDCRVASLSLAFDPTRSARDGFSEIGKEALSQNLLIVAAAGNRGPDTVTSPASAEGILAVGAIDLRGALYPRSCPSGPAPGEEVDLVAPGVDVLAAVPDGGYYSPFTYRTGTSLAAPHVAGVAALWFEQGYTADEILNRLKKHAAALPGTTIKEAGSGLVTAP